MIYKTINQIPPEHQHLFERLIKNGVLKINSKKEINISSEIYEVILILARLGLTP